MSTVTLHDGRQVDSASEEWRRECLQRWERAAVECNRHVNHLMATGSSGARRAYLEQLDASDKSMADRVRAEFLKRWKARA